MKIAPFIYNAYNICHREAWLMYRNLIPDQQDENLIIGKIIDEESYARNKKHFYIPDLNAEIDMVEKKDGVLIVAEIKKSSKMIDYAVLQLKYYLYLLNLKGIKVFGFLNIPNEKKRIKVELSNNDIQNIEETLKTMEKILISDNIPAAERKIFCTRCAYNEFCWS
jgi:CRISPR-associated exonuclease Cas4